MWVREHGCMRAGAEVQAYRRHVCVGLPVVAPTGWLEGNRCAMCVRVAGERLHTVLGI